MTLFKFFNFSWGLLMLLDGPNLAHQPFVVITMQYALCQNVCCLVFTQNKRLVYVLAVRASIKVYGHDPIVFTGELAYGILKAFSPPSLWS